MKPATLLWLRNDLRLSDHAALAAAIKEDGPVVPLFVLDDETAGPWSAGGAARWWLHHSLASLDEALRDRDSRLVLRRGRAADVVAEVARQIGARIVVCSRRYEPWAIGEEKRLKAALDKDGISLKRFSGALLIEPERVATQSGDPYKVYTPFWRAVSSQLTCDKPLPAPKAIPAPKSWPKSDRLPEWKLLPSKPDWARGFGPRWTPGEVGAHERLADFIAEHAGGYAEDRNRPDLPATSRLSPYLAHGEISPRAIWWRVSHARDTKPAAGKGLETFLKELVWREFSYHLLVHFPTLPEKPFRSEFAAFPWTSDKPALQAWQRGLTGYPIVDAGMRELWATGWMHNRVRMIVASFLIKDLLVPWQQGEAWFWDTLVDADLANNAASWQWVAGSGADAAPYFRIFNPVTQGEKFDPEGTYVRRWVPELSGLPDDLVHRPFEAGEQELKAAGVTLGKTYPAPIVDHRAARDRALAAFKSLKG